MKKPLLSIIVPVYNSSTYLVRCVDSIINQTYANTDIILVDDGSTDDSGTICDDYAQKDCRVHVIHQTNGGMSSARNRGLEMCKGDYVTFIDSDDYYGTLTTLEENMQFFEDNPQLDGLQYPYQETESLRIYGQVDKSIYYDYNDFILRAYFENKIVPVVWNKIYRRDRIDDLKFPLDRYYEDVHFILNMNERIHTFVISNKGLYRYFTANPESVTRRKQSTKQLEDKFDAIYVAANKAKQLYSDKSPLYLKEFKPLLFLYISAYELKNICKSKINEMSPPISFSEYWRYSRILAIRWYVYKYLGYDIAHHLYRFYKLIRQI